MEEPQEVLWIIQSDVPNYEIKHFRSQELSIYCWKILRTIRCCQGDRVWQSDDLILVSSSIPGDSGSVSRDRHLPTTELIILKDAAGSRTFSTSSPDSRHISSLGTCGAETSPGHNSGFLACVSVSAKICISSLLEVVFRPPPSTGCVLAAVLLPSYACLLVSPGTQSRQLWRSSVDCRSILMLLVWC